MFIKMVFILSEERMMGMFAPANIVVNIGQNDFPVIGEIGYGEKGGKKYTVIVREIRGMEWVGEGDDLALLVKVIVEINDREIINQLDKNINDKPRNKFTVIEGGK